MLPILTIFIVFLVVLTYHIKKSDSAQAKVQEEFWEKERLSNAVRKQDLSSLNYITIPIEKIPHKIHTKAEEELFALSQKTIVNLTGISNTDLKLTYGTANLALLSEYDNNFSNMVTILPIYTEELLDAGYLEDALMLLEFAAECKADSAQIYLQLASIYQQKNDTDKLKELSRIIEELPSLTKLSVKRKLS